MWFSYSVQNRGAGWDPTKSVALTQQHDVQSAGLQYTAQPAHDSDSEESEPEGGYSDEDWLEDEVQVEDEEVHPLLQALL